MTVARWGAAIMAVLFLLWTAVVASGITAGADAHVLAALRDAGRQDRPDFADWIVDASRFLTLIGGGTTRAPLAVVAALVLMLLHRSRAAAALLAAWGGGTLLVEGLKALVARPRPDLVWRLEQARGASFPSGHAAGSMILFPLLGWLLGRLIGRRGAWVPAVLGVGLALVVGVSRVLLGVHWAADVVGGWLLGAAIALLAASAPGGAADDAGGPKRGDARSPFRSWG